ncbi:butyrophilin-like protein 1 [Coregonus clupeaformis]|uniref:butyrophilin-like protein 1 n=1 Tax=Coregonus clupeaformis TaxID=59861 RepID=UPI001BDFD2FE|nr:butyrophilin-like protein 1 [Coregonus clupeaformis]
MLMSVCLIRTVLHIAAGCTLSGPEVTQITAYSGQPVLLPCSCSEPDAKPEYVRRTVEAEPIREILAIRKSSVSDEYRGRVQVFNNEKHPGNLSLQLATITEKDDALYRCKINGSRFRDIRLHVKGCTLSGPECTELTASPGQSVLLPCSCTDPQAKPHSFTWSMGSRLAISDIWSSLSSNWNHVYRHRVQLSSNSSPGDLSLLLTNFTHRDEGLYACKMTSHNITAHRLIFLTGKHRHLVISSLMAHCKDTKNNVAQMICINAYSGI